MAPRRMTASERWLRLLLHLYPVDFREDMGDSLVEAYLDRYAEAAVRRPRRALAGMWVRALADSLRNGLAERLRPAISWRRAGNWGRDAEIAVRRLVRAPAFTLSIIGTLTVGLGAFAVVVTIVDKVLIEPLPYQRPGDLYFVWRDYRAFFDLDRGWLGGPDVAALDGAGGPIAAAVGLRRERRTLADSAAGDRDPEEVGAMITSPNLFTVLGVNPVLGRGFGPDEVGPDRPAVAVLGHDLWLRRFGGDPAVIGRTIRLSGDLFTVIGVMGPDFHFVRHSSIGPPEGADLYLTFPYQLAERPVRSGAFAGLVRARPGTSPDQLAAAVAAVGRSLDAEHFASGGLKWYPVALGHDLVAGVKPAFLVLGLSGIFLVLVLTVNLATLLLARAVQREREFAVSRALGANLTALVRASLVEAALLGAAAGAGAVLVAVWGTRALVALAPSDLPRRASIAVDWRIGAVVIGLGTLLGLVAGAAPAFWASRSTLSAMLRNTAVRGGGRGGLRRTLVVVQVALSLTLLSTGGLVARSFEALLRSRPGFDPTGVLTIRVPIGQWRYPDNASAVTFQARLESELAGLPGVLSVGAASAIPLTAGTDQSAVVLPGAPGNTGQQEHDAPLADVLQSRRGWFQAVGIPMLAGRDFEPAQPGALREAVIDRTLAADFFPSGGAVGTRLMVGQDSLLIVGVVEHARQADLHRDGRPQVYLRDEDDTYGPLYFAIRAERPLPGLIPEVRTVLRRIDPALAISEVRTLDEVVDESLRQQRVTAVLVAGFSLGALLLAAMGLFGIIAGSVARRRHEIAVRLALGANRARILRLVLREGAALVLLGAAVAVPGIYLSGRTIRGVLVGISPFDPLTLVLVAAGLALVSLAACYLPARRVGSIQPAQALREE